MDKGHMPVIPTFFFLISQYFLLPTFVGEVIVIMIIFHLTLICLPALLFFDHVL